MLNSKTTKTKLFLNTTLSLALEAITIICGLILPRFILGTYGSGVNGLVNSIAQFLQIISFLDLGVGAVVQSALYKPLAEKNNEEISKIISSAQKFFRRIAYILLAYVFVLVFVYPVMIDNQFDWIFSALLVAAMSISYFAQYYFGVVDRLLLIANQEGYIAYGAQIITLVINTIACVIEIKLGLSIQFVKLSTSIIFLTRPILIRLYVNKKYLINRRISYSVEPIKQKWNGMAQHVSYVVLTSTDNIILTLFSTLDNVSIYSVYHMVIYGIKQLFISMTNGIKALIGELWAKQDLEKLNDVFELAEWLIHMATVLVFTLTWKLILPFVAIYTNNVSDAQYIQPVFAAVLVAAHAIHCLRIPYNMLILATGAYKESQNMHVITAAINLVISAAVVKYYGLVGVAVGTLIAMLYQTVWMVLFDSKNNIKWPISKVIKLFAFDIVNVCLIILTTSFFNSDVTNFIEWFVLAVKCGIIGLAVLLLSNCVLYTRNVKRMLVYIKGKGK